MNTFKKFTQIIPSIASVLLIILFVYAACSKFLDFDNFQVQIGQSPLLTAYADTVSWGIPIYELVIAAFLCVPKYVYYAFFASYSLLVMFTTYIVIILKFSDFIPCSCGGVLEKLSWTEHILFNILFIVITILGIIFTIDYNQTNTREL